VGCSEWGAGRCVVCRGLRSLLMAVVLVLGEASLKWPSLNLSQPSSLWLVLAAQTDRLLIMHIAIFGRQLFKYPVEQLVGFLCVACAHQGSHRVVPCRTTSFPASSLASTHCGGAKLSRKLVVSRPANAVSHHSEVNMSPARTGNRRRV
jgi:hypothetical protein